MAMQRIWVLLTLGCILVASLRADRPTPKIETIRGKVVRLADLLAKTGDKVDEDAAAYSLVVVSDNGSVYPLVKDSGSRLFFLDKALLNRPMQLTGRLVPRSTLLRVGAVHSIHKGTLHEVYYWCDICSIRRSEKHICECCGGPMELKEDPVKP